LAQRRGRAGARVV